MADTSPTEFNSNQTNVVDELKRTEELARAKMHELETGIEYDGRWRDIIRLEKVVRDAQIRRLRIEAYKE